MKRKILILISALMIVMICTSCAVIDSLIERTISEEKVESYLNDSIDAVAYLFAYDTDYADKSEIDGDIKVRLSAATYQARTADIEMDDSSYIIPGEKMEGEIGSIFSDTDISDFKNNDFVSRDDSGTYHLVCGDWGDSSPVFKITDAFYGIIGSEPTRITVRYTFAGDEGEMSDRYDYEAHFTLVEDKESPYTFKITEFSGENLIPVEAEEEIVSVDEQSEEESLDESVDEFAETQAQDVEKEEVDGKGDVFFSKDEMPYVEIIEKHKKAIAEGWGPEDFNNAEMSYLFMDCQTEDQVGFCVKYMDDSTYPWLFVGTMTGEPFVDDMILDAYSLDENGNLIHQFTGWERNRYYYVDMGTEYPVIANEGSSSADLSDNYYFYVEDGALKLREGVIYDGFTDENNPWFYVNAETVKDKKAEENEDTSWPYNLSVPRYEASDGTPITEDEANAITGDYTAKYRQLDLRAISEGYEILED